MDPTMSASSLGTPYRRPGGESPSGTASHSRLPGQGVSRNRRRGIAQSLQTRSPSGRGSLEKGGSPTSSTAMLPGPVDEEEEEVMLLRAENRLLRRQLEDHPELHRLGSENRLLREHLASMVQQHALAREEPPWPKGHRHARRAHDGDSKAPAAKNEGKEGLQLTRKPSLTRTSKSSFFGLGEGSVASTESPRKTTLSDALKTSVVSPALSKSGNDNASSKGLSVQPFPGIEDATQISPSSSSAESEGEDDDISPKAGLSATGASVGEGRGGHGATQGAADASSFLPTMAREVEDLLHVKGGLEDALKQLVRSFRSQRDSPMVESPLVRGLPHLGSKTFFTPASTNMEVEPRVATEILRSTADALRIAESMLSKGKGEPLWLSAGGAQDSDSQEGTSVNQRGSEGLDERDVFVSLMRSLPSESPSLSRHGFASSAPNISGLRGHGASGTGSSNPASAFPTLRLSCSTGSAGTRMMRNRSTMQLHRIAETPLSPITGKDERSGNTTPLASARGTPSGGTAEPDVGEPSEMLKEAGQKVQQLCRHLEHINDAYRDIREQYKPLQEEYFRRHDECRFLEAQFRRLDVHCRLLEERAPKDGTVLPSRKLFVNSTGNMHSRFARIQGLGTKPGTSMWRNLSDSASRSSGASIGSISPSGSREQLLRVTPTPSPPLQPSMPTATLRTTTIMSGTESRTGSKGPAIESAHMSNSSASPPRRSSSTTALGPASPAGTPMSVSEVPPRGLLYAASVNEVRGKRMESHQRHTGSVHVLGTAASPPWRTQQDYIRRVASAPQLQVMQPMSQLLVQDRQVLQRDGQATVSTTRAGYGSGSGTGAGMGAGIAGAGQANISASIRSSGLARAGISTDEDQAAVAALAGGGGPGSAAASVGAHGTYSPEEFLTLAMQPGEKTAALQYLMASTRNALGTIGESPEPRPLSAAAGRSPHSSPARSASVGSLGGISNLGTPAMGVAGNLGGQTLQSGLSSPTARHAVTGPAAAARAGITDERAPYRGQLGKSGSGAATVGGDTRDRLRELLGPSSSLVGPAAPGQTHSTWGGSSPQPPPSTVRPIAGTPQTVPSSNLSLGHRAGTPAGSPPAGGASMGSQASAQYARRTNRLF